jgi:hypothetical protein
MLKFSLRCYFTSIINQLMTRAFICTQISVNDEYSDMQVLMNHWVSHLLLQTIVSSELKHGNFGS